MNILFALGGIALAQSSQAVVHATVLENYTCTDETDSNAWTYSTLQVHEVLEGALLTDESDRFVVRTKVGHYRDGSRGGVLGTPQLVLGDEVVLPIHFNEEGDQLLTSLIPNDPLAWRVVRFPLTTVEGFVDFNGRVVVGTNGRVGTSSAQIQELRRDFPTDVPNSDIHDREQAAIELWVNERVAERTEKYLVEIELWNDQDHCGHIRKVDAESGDFEVICNLSGVGSVTAGGFLLNEGPIVEVDEILFGISETPQDGVAESHQDLVRVQGTNADGALQITGIGSTPKGRGVNYRIWVENWYGTPVAEKASGIAQRRSSSVVDGSVVGKSADPEKDRCFIQTGPVTLDEIGD